MSVIVAPAVISAIGLTASNGAGPISAPGLKVGDRAIAVFLTSSGHVSHQNPGDFVEAIISVDDEIQQLDTSNLSTSTVDVFLLRLP
jgi:hypothetical protein